MGFDFRHTVKERDTFFLSFLIHCNVAMFGKFQVAAKWSNFQFKGLARKVHPGKDKPQAS
jgi:hypothetical protein